LSLDRCSPQFISKPSRVNSSSASASCARNFISWFMRQKTAWRAACQGQKEPNRLPRDTEARMRSVPDEGLYATAAGDDGMLRQSELTRRQGIQIMTAFAHGSGMSLDLSKQAMAGLDLESSSEHGGLWSRCRQCACFETSAAQALPGVSEGNLLGQRTEILVACLRSEASPSRAGPLPRPGNSAFHRAKKHASW